MRIKKFRRDGRIGFSFSRMPIGDCFGLGCLKTNHHQRKKQSRIFFPVPVFDWVEIHKVEDQSHQRFYKHIDHHFLGLLLLGQDFWLVFSGWFDFEYLSHHLRQVQYESLEGNQRSLSIEESLPDFVQVQRNYKPE